jgi:hypothetical protein
MRSAGRRDSGASLSRRLPKSLSIRDTGGQIE